MVHLFNSITVTERTYFPLFLSYFTANAICAWLRFVKYDLITITFCFLNDLVILYGLVRSLSSVSFIIRMQPKEQSSQQKGHFCIR